MNSQLLDEPPQQVQPRSDAEVADVGALFASILFPPFGIVLGHVARAQARRHGMYPSAPATLGMVLGYIFTLAYVIALIVIITAALHTAAASCDLSNPNFPNC